MQNYNSKRKIIITFLIAVAAAILVSIGFLPRKTSYEEIALDEFAKCLTEKNITMYGADWCPHCQNEKLAFGDSFRFIPYVECPDEPQVCIEAGIEGYPTWIFSDGRRLEGEQGPLKLSQESGCEFPLKATN